MLFFPVRKEVKAKVKFEMALRKQPDRQVKQKRIIKMPENVHIAITRKRKLEVPGVEVIFKMASRKQPDRQVKKKRKSELEEPRDFDILGTLVCNYGMTGENLVREIFSYLDVSSLQKGHLVCKTWSLFLINDKRVWMDILRPTQPYFKFVSKQLLLDEDFASDAEKYFDSIEKNDKLCCHKIIQVFRRIQMIYVVLQDVIQDCPIYEVFQKKFIGENFFGEIQPQVDAAKEEKQPNAKIPKCGNRFELNFARLLVTIITIKASRDEVKRQREILQEIFDKWGFRKDTHKKYQEWIEARAKEHISNNQLLISKIGATLFGA